MLMRYGEERKGVMKGKLRVEGEVNEICTGKLEGRPK